VNTALTGGFVDKPLLGNGRSSWFRTAFTAAGRATAFGDMPRCFRKSLEK
jgi:hypothetical protein